MQRVVVLGFDGALASAITGVVDLFAMAGVSWNRIQQQDVQRLFKVSIASQDGQPIRCINGLELQAHCSYQEIQTADIVVVPTIAAPIQDVLQQNPELIQFLKSAHADSTLIAGNCTGNFFLAEAGILDNRVATTHWGFQDIFRTHYPQVKLNADLMISRDQNIYCAGGGLAWFDLGLHLIERFYGFEVAMQSAKSFVIDYRRDSQLSYSLLKIGQPHHDELVQNVQNWLEQHFHESFSLDDIATRFNVTTRTLIRHFKQALDLPPNQYLQAIRIEAARKRLEETDQAVDVIMQNIGYQDPSSFRRLFHRKTGLTPLEYRRRFSRRF
ncbi:helix-turn-helix domain-containing protein [Acinetobacter sp. 18QD2AZ41W]|uniref:GlxA family transcriptional regulator n=1 Tax=Acinetobacter sp. 18QD2AZ41W TaxID=2692137 RepID=UPI00135752ED|nr:helix-turn-helix domain-containing protein [Acinetobacter sp. 18QD2AZ41W]HJE54044.1 helix-turn-helix domain-containing protein [Acinetobacter pseudolwoffii]